MKKILFVNPSTKDDMFENIKVLSLPPLNLAEDIFDKTIDFVHDTKIDGAQFSIQTPFPGTRIWEQLSRENRLLLKDYPRDWKRYHGFEVVFQPKNMTVAKLTEGHAYAYKTVASFKSSLFRAMKTFSNTKSFLATAISFYWNFEFSRKILREYHVERNAAKSWNCS